MCHSWGSQGSARAGVTHCRENSGCGQEEGHEGWWNNRGLGL